MDGEEGTGVEKWAKKKLQFIALASFFSFLCSFYSGFSSYNLQVSTLIFSLFAHAIDRKYVFLICNGILALLVNNFTFFGFIKSAEDGAKQIREDIPTVDGPSGLTFSNCWSSSTATTPKVGACFRTNLRCINCCVENPTPRERSQIIFNDG